MATRSRKTTATSTTAKSTTAKKTTAISSTAPKAASPAPTATTPAKPAAAKVVPRSAPSAPATTVVEDVTPTLAQAPIKKPELIDRVVAETGLKKKDVKPVVEAMLAVMGRSLAAGEELTVPPLGKVMVKRVKDVANATVITVKVRHPKSVAGSEKDPLAQAAD
ncbi:HU family DNA-binding protein [Thalassorhabdomicrobium marinisediminis]|uniref:HU family DNA-binding protein n=1 Tax=Thalassorhabdomicrobium marinisediminis TaxID=2170577 RepID=UPI002490D05F|nr:HU family DNA-binding protein [Thalassorhabdomicrobium marinisediminis]